MSYGPYIPLSVSAWRLMREFSHRRLRVRRTPIASIFHAMAVRSLTLLVVTAWVASHRHVPHRALAAVLCLSPLVTIPGHAVGATIVAYAHGVATLAIAGWFATYRLARPKTR